MIKTQSDLNQLMQISATGCENIWCADCVMRDMTNKMLPDKIWITCIRLQEQVGAKDTRELAKIILKKI